MLFAGGLASSALVVTELRSILSHLQSRAHGDSVLATLVTVSGSSYRRPGARVLINPEGRRVGSISGGCLEEDVVCRATAVSRTGRPELITYDTTSENDLVWGVGLGCHGVVQVLLEKISAPVRWVDELASNLDSDQRTELAVIWQSTDPSILGTRLASEIPQLGNRSSGVFLDHVNPPTRLVIFGAGDDAQPLCRIAKEIGWHVTVADPRRDFVSSARFPLADALVCAAASELVGRSIGASTAVAVVMTHHYVHDLPVLKELLPYSSTYVGLLGPKKRAEKLLGDLAAQGILVRGEHRAHLHAPVGFDLGAETPQEVALSIVAEIQAFLKNRNGRSLRERTGPIHG